MSDNADIAARDIEFLLEHYEELMDALIDQTPIEPAMLYLYYQSVETNLVLLRALLYDLLDFVEPLLPSLAHAVIETRSAMAEREETYAHLEATTFSRAELLTDCQKYRERFLGCLASYAHDSAVNKLDIHKLSNALIIRTWLAYLLDYLYRDDPQTLMQEVQSLDAALRARIPRAFIDWLGSWDDHDYRCTELEPLAHWWRYREGYAAQDVTHTGGA